MGMTTPDKKQDNRSWNLTQVFGLVFTKSSEEAREILNALKQKGVPCTEANQHNGTYVIEVDPRLYPDGLPVSASFVGTVKNAGGHFYGGPVCSLLNHPVFRIGLA